LVIKEDLNVLFNDTSTNKSETNPRLARLAELLAFDPTNEVAISSTHEGPEVALTPLPEPGHSPTQMQSQPENGRSLELNTPLKLSTDESAPSPSGQSSPVTTSFPKELDLPELRQNVRMIADALMGALSQVVNETQARREASNAQVTAILKDFDQITARLRSQQEQLEQVVAGRQELITKIEEIARPVSALEDRLRNIEERLLAAETQIREQSEQVSALAAAGERREQTQQSLANRLETIEFIIETIEADSQRRGAWLDKLLTSIRGLDNRGEQRYHADAPVQVTTVGETPQVIAGRLVNLSKKGLGLVLEAPIAAGIQVEITVEGRVLNGTVRYCRPRSDGYWTGIVLGQALAVPAE